MLLTDEQKAKKYALAGGELQALLRAASGRKIVLYYFVDGNGREFVEIFDANVRICAVSVDGDSLLTMSYDVLKGMLWK